MMTLALLVTASMTGLAGEPAPLVGDPVAGADVVEAPAAEPALDPQTLEQGRLCTRRFYDGEAGMLWEDFDADMRKVLGSEAQILAFRNQVLQQLGAEASVVEESTRDVAGISVYKRTARFEKLDQLFEVLFSFTGELTGDSPGDSTGEGRAISGFTIQPVREEAPSDYLEYETKTAMQLPFQGKWYIFWGGRTLDENYHTFTRDQRFAYDILMMVDGKTHTGDGQQLEDYHCFGQKVFAPGAGTVHVAVDGIEDNAPGEMNPAQALGNHVILDHGNGEYSFLAHFQKGSVQVETGGEVEAGQFLGHCGNSGNTTEPHIHFHLQDTPDFGAGQGMPCQFLDYVADGDKVSRGEPVRGQTVRND